MRLSFRLQLVTNLARGIPQSEGSGVPAEMSAGMAVRWKYQMVTPSEVHSVA